MSKNRTKNKEAKRLKKFTTEASASYATEHPQGSEAGFSASFEANAERIAAATASYVQNIS